MELEIRNQGLDEASSFQGSGKTPSCPFWRLVAVRSSACQGITLACLSGHVAVPVLLSSVALLQDVSYWIRGSSYSTRTYANHLCRDPLSKQGHVRRFWVVMSCWGAVIQLRTQVSLAVRVPPNRLSISRFYLQFASRAKKPSPGTGPDKSKDQAWLRGSSWARGQSRSSRPCFLLLLRPLKPSWGPGGCGGPVH